jgi:hypothetical protein
MYPGVSASAFKLKQDHREIKDAGSDSNRLHEECLTLQQSSPFVYYHDHKASDSKVNKVTRQTGHRRQMATNADGSWTEGPSPCHTAIGRLSLVLGIDDSDSLA